MKIVNDFLSESELVDLSTLGFGDNEIENEMNQDFDTFCDDIMDLLDDRENVSYDILDY